MWRPDQLAEWDLSEIGHDYALLLGVDECHQLFAAHVGREYARECYTSWRWLGDQLRTRGVSVPDMMALCAAAGALAASLYHDGYAEPWIAAATVLEHRDAWDWLSDRGRCKYWLRHNSVMQHGTTDPIFPAVRRMLRKG